MSVPAAKPYKAVAAFVLTFLSTLAVAFDPAAEHHPVTWQEWAFVIIGSLVTTAAVYGITNPPAGMIRRERI